MKHAYYHPYEYEQIDIWIFFTVEQISKLSYTTAEQAFSSVHVSIW